MTKTKAVIVAEFTNGEGGPWTHEDIKGWIEDSVANVLSVTICNPDETKNFGESLERPRGGG